MNFLKSTEAFSPMGSEKLSALTDGASVIEAPAGHRVDHGEWDRWIWVPVQGLLRLSYPTADGNTLTVYLAGRGELVGCLDALCRVDHDLQAHAVVDSLVAILSRARVTEAVERDPRTAARVIHSLSERVWSCRELSAACSVNAEQRLARALVLLASRLGATMALTRKTLAEISGLARETAIRGLGPLEDQGIIRSSRGRIEIVDRPRLEKLAADR